MLRNATIRHGRSFPLGSTLSPEGVNFSVFSKSATLVELLLFDQVDDAQPARVIRLDPRRHRTYHYWHVFVPGLTAGQLYGYRVSGPCEPDRGLRSRRSQRDRRGHALGEAGAQGQALGSQLLLRPRQCLRRG